MEGTQPLETTRARGLELDIFADNFANIQLLFDEILGLHSFTKAAYRDSLVPATYTQGDPHE